MGRRARSRLAAIVLASVAFAVVADPEESFKKGIAALDLEKWPEAARHLRAAVRENPRESEDRVFLSGVFSSPYLPHYYLGWALYNGGLQNCRDALVALDVSESQGIVQGFKRQFQSLRAARERCNSEVLPSAFESASDALRRAARLAAQTAEPVADGALERDRLAALEKIANASGTVEAGMRGARLSELLAAERAATEAVTLLEGVASQTTAAAAQRLAVATAAARLEIEAAGEAERRLRELLADPARNPAWNGADLEMPAAAVARLESARAGLRDATDLARVEQAQKDAQTAAAGFARTRDRADEAYARFVEQLRQQADRDPSSVAERAVPPSPVPALRPAPGSETASPVPASKELLNEILRLRTLGSRLLAELGTEATDSELLETQKSRLTLLILEARERGTDDGAAALESLHGRLASSLAALQLVEGARAFLAGEMPRAVDVLSDCQPADDALAAQAQLFLAAALHALYRAGGESDERLASRAVAAVRECRQLAPALMPDAAVFSPAFRIVFQAREAQNR